MTWRIRSKNIVVKNIVKILKKQSKVNQKKNVKNAKMLNKRIVQNGLDM